MYKLYIGKMALNKLRQEQGYKEGTYKKNWRGIEDNGALYKFIGDMGDKEIDFDIFYGAINHFYELYIK